MVVWRWSWWCGGGRGGVEVVAVVWRWSWWCRGGRGGVEVVVVVWWLY